MLTVGVIHLVNEVKRTKSNLSLSSQPNLVDRMETGLSGVVVGHTGNTTAVI